MSIVSSIDVTLFDAPAPSQTLDILHDAGWQFWEGRVSYQHFIEYIEADWSYAEPGEWENTQRLLDAKCSEGQKIAIQQQWRDEDEEVIFTFYSRDVVHVLLSGFSHRICGRFSDFSWYLDRILCPLDKAQYTILEVTCNDDNY